MPVAEVPVAGTVLAAQEYTNDLILVGDETKIRQELNRIGRSHPRVSIRHAGSVVEMDEPAAQSIRRKKDSSISVAVDMVKHGEADAMVSAGHTGATVAAATLKLRLLEGVDRPGIGVTFPTLGGPSFLIDVGANIGHFSYDSIDDSVSLQVIKINKETVYNSVEICINANNIICGMRPVRRCTCTIAMFILGRKPDGSVTHLPEWLMVSSPPGPIFLVHHPYSHWYIYQGQ